MIARAICPDDLIKIKEIHEQFYKNEFEFPDFTKSLCVFVITDEDQIICAVDLHPILEVTLMTDKRVSVFRRKSALFEVLAACKHLGQNLGFNQLHAFVQESIWKRALKRFGFTNTKGDALMINIEG